MATPAERILQRLPSTFRPVPPRSALRAVADAVGGEGTGVENALARVMQAHWVEHADRGVEEIVDLALFAALYGLGPQPEEDVEVFRAHLLRYVRTFLEGTVTVQGLLRIAADALALPIADAWGDIDVWWRRGGDTLVTVEARRDDAAALIFGVGETRSAAADARAAAIAGTVALTGALDLAATPTLELSLDGAAPVSVDLAGATGAQAVVDAISAAAGADVARLAGERLVLSSPTAGAAGRITVGVPEGDAAAAILGLTPRRASGRAAAPARITGVPDLTGGVDLAAGRFLRLRVDGAQTAEVDCVGAGPTATTLDGVRDAINAALAGVATHAGGHLVLTSPTAGPAGRLEILTAAAQDAAQVLLGPAPRYAAGAGASPARIAGTVDIAAGVDLTGTSALAVGVDGDPPVVVDCAGADPALTLGDEVVASINAALAADVAGLDGHQLTLTSPTADAGGALVVATPPDPGTDAAAALLGLAPRWAAGADATRPRIVAGPGPEFDLRARHLLGVALDDGVPVTVDLARRRADAEAVRAALVEALGDGVATLDGGRLVLTSPTPGPTAAVAIVPLDRTRRRRFVSRAVITDEAATTLLGVPAAAAQGTAATAARIEGTARIAGAVDLTRARRLRIAVDAAPAVEVDCAGPRPRATTLAEVLARIAVALPGIATATTDGRLVLTSPTPGAAGHVAVQPPLGPLDLFGLTPGEARGSPATGVTFTGVADLRAGADLSGADRLRIGVDGAPAVEVPCAGADPAQTGLLEIVGAINAALGSRVARIAGTSVALHSDTTGAGSQIALEVPTGGPDATAAIFGVAAPRAYHGADAAPARITGTAAVAGPIDLTGRRFLTIGLSPDPAREIDCAAGAADPAAATIAEVVAAVNGGLGATVAAADGAGHLVLTAPDPDRRITLTPSAGDDAAPRLLGAAPADAAGRDAAPARITGTPQLGRPVDLSRRSHLMLAVDDGRPVDVDVAGAIPAQTFLDEVVAAIEAVLPGVAGATDDDHLVLSSPGTAAVTSIAVLPLRHLEVVEYPARRAGLTVESVHHGGGWSIVNDGAAEAGARIVISEPQGAALPAIAGLTQRAMVRLLAVVPIGGRAVIAADRYDGRLRAWIEGPDRPREDLPPERIQVTALARTPLPVDRDSALTLPRGRSDWRYLECDGTRFDAAWFDRSHFSGGSCAEVAVFDASRFALPGTPVQAVFGATVFATTGGARIEFTWDDHRPGTVEINLPRDLPERSGATFGAARFASGATGAERYAGVVMEPAGDPDDLAVAIGGAGPATLATARHVGTVPLGWSAVTVPVRAATRLTRGAPGRAAAIYLKEPDAPDFIELTARAEGEWGNSIAVTARPAGPARYDVAVDLQGARFENARVRAAGPDLTGRPQTDVAPGPVGVNQAKAAGVRATVTRDGTRSTSTDNQEDRNDA